MSWASKLLGFEVNVADSVEAVGNAIDRVVTSDEERMQAELLLAKMRQKPHILQAEITKIQASHRTIFVAGARPALLWICVAGFTYTYVLYPVLLWANAIWFQGHPPPELVTDGVMMELVLAMLGLGGMRMNEKIKGVTK